MKFGKTFQFYYLLIYLSWKDLHHSKLYIDYMISINMILIPTINAIMFAPYYLQYPFWFFLSMAIKSIHFAKLVCNL